ncbi:ATP-binding protein [Luteococcus sediminum]
MSSPDLPAPRPQPEPPRARRDAEHAVLGGVCSGIAQHLGWSPLLVRGGFVLLAGMQLVGVLVYGLLWVLMPSAAQGDSVEAPGLESARRQQMRPQRHRELARPDGASAAALALVGGGVALLAHRFGTGPSSTIFWPLAFAAAGLAMVWRQADAQDLATDRTAPQRWKDASRLLVGLALVGVSVSIVAAGWIGISQLPQVLGFAALLVLGVGIAGAPWITRWRRTSREAHERALLERARADMAAHLHDSVLQTLALIQRQSEDPKAVAQLARRQEKELRTWLYGEEQTESSLTVAMRTAVDEIEAERGIDIELVCVGDAEGTSRTDTVVRAAREAMMNAAKHSGADRVDVYCEVDDGQVEVFVRDRGVGFDPEAIGDDRMGVRRSILDRMERHGGTARIRSAPGEGTEVRLVMEI